jgi:hypothetical protein
VAKHVTATAPRFPCLGFSRSFVCVPHPCPPLSTAGMQHPHHRRASSIALILRFLDTHDPGVQCASRCIRAGMVYEHCPTQNNLPQNRCLRHSGRLFHRPRVALSKLFIRSFTHFFVPMARTKQTARRSTGGKAPRKQLATKVSLLFLVFRATHRPILGCTQVRALCGWCQAYWHRRHEETPPISTRNSCAPRNSQVPEIHGNHPQALEYAF